MPKGNDRPTVKNEEQYEALKKQGMSKKKAARIANSGKEASKKGGKSSKYDDWTKQELVNKAKEVGIKGYSSMKKDELIDALRNS